MLHISKQELIARIDEAFENNRLSKKLKLYKYLVEAVEAGRTVIYEPKRPGRSKAVKLRDIQYLLKTAGVECSKGVKQNVFRGEYLRLLIRFTDA